MLHSNERVIKHKVSLLNLAEELGNVSKACQMMGLSRDTFYRYKAAVEEGGVEALLEKDRRRPNLKNRTDQRTEAAVLAYALRLIRRLRTFRRLEAHRARPAADVGALAQAASRLSRLAAGLGDLVAEIDINPILVHASGATAVDALVVGTARRATSRRGGLFEQVKKGGIPRALQLGLWNES